MKNFGIMILCISLAISAFLFALNGRYQVTTYEGDLLGQSAWMRCDTITGRTWVVSDKGMHWTEIRDYGYAYVKPEDDKGKD